MVPHTELISSCSDVMQVICCQICVDISGDNSSLELQHLACTVYHRALQDLPAIVRQWWNAQDKRVAGIVDKYRHLVQTNLIFLCMICHDRAKNKLQTNIFL